VNFTRWDRQVCFVEIKLPLPGFRLELICDFSRALVLVFFCLGDWKGIWDCEKPAVEIPKDFRGDPA